MYNVNISTFHSPRPRNVVGQAGVLMFYIFGLRFGGGAPPSPAAPAPTAVALDPVKMRQERVAAAQRRAAEIEVQASAEEQILMAEEDADYYRGVLKKVRDDRQNRRKSPTT